MWNQDYENHLLAREKECYFNNQLLKWNKEEKAVLHGIEIEMEDMDPGLAAIIVMITYFKEG